MPSGNKHHTINIIIIMAAAGVACPGAGWWGHGVHGAPHSAVADGRMYQRGGCLCPAPARSGAG